MRETILYSAGLRLPDKMPWKDKRDLVDSTINEMGLQDCADTVIGNWHLRGISGGEKRRVSIAIEILMRPRLLFLDEPTSGLDRYSYPSTTLFLRLAPSLLLSNRRGSVGDQKHVLFRELFECSIAFSYVLRSN